MKPQKETVSLIVNGRVFNESTENIPYFYNEHTCPTNYMRDALEVFLGNEKDPHGIFEFVGVLTEFNEDTEVLPLVDQ